jgi:hypothetical protein
MEHLRKFVCLPRAERRLLIKAALLLEAIKLGIRLLPFQTVRRLLAQVADARVRLRRIDSFSAKRVGWAVEIASCHTPGVKTCLAQALAVQVLLRRRGYPALLHIGVVRAGQEQFEAHAWVESDGEVVIGGSKLERYTPLTALEVEGPRELRDQKP